MKKQMKKILKIIGLSLMALILIGLAGFAFWASDAAQPEEIALESLASTERVHFTRQNQWLVFSPAESPSPTGLILYPGARVDPRAYAPAASAIASGGVTVVIVPMPINMAIFGINRAEDVFKAFPAIQTWAIGGHSLGGAMAAEFAQSHPTQVSGLVLWAAYPGGGNDLSQSELVVLSISASEDGLATPGKINASRELLPESTQFVEIQGGNHAGFGRYGAQSGDGEATLGPADQQAQIFDATLDFLRSLTTNEDMP
jgi:hypothetical protein